MKKTIKENWKEGIKILVIVLIASVFAVQAASWLKTDNVQDTIESLGLLGPIVIILYVAASHVFAPLAGSPGMIVALSLYGFVQANIILYLGSMLSATVNFYIARRLGRKWVVKLSGKDSTNRIDQFTAVMGRKLLVSARIFGAPLFEFVSYATGFTDMDFRTYIIITAITTPLVGVPISYLFYTSLGSTTMFSFALLGLIIIGAIYSTYIVQLYRRRV